MRFTRFHIAPKLFEIENTKEKMCIHIKDILHFINTSKRNRHIAIEKSPFSPIIIKVTKSTNTNAIAVESLTHFFFSTMPSMPNVTAISIVSKEK